MRSPANKIRTFCLVLCQSALAISNGFATQFNSDKLIGQNLCDAERTYSFNRGLREPFDQDPTVIAFNEIEKDGAIYVLAVDTSIDRTCGKIVAALQVKSELGGKTNSDIGLNCTVLNQAYSRYKAYIGIHSRDFLQYTPTKGAWTFDLNSRKFETYPKPQNVYCENFFPDAAE